MKKIGLFCVIFGLTSMVMAQNTSIALSEMDLSKVFQSYGSAMKNLAVTGEGLSVNGVGYGDGIGVQAEGRMKIVLNGNASRFTCLVGVNDNAVDYAGKDVIQIPMTDGEMVFYKTSGDNKQFVGVGTGDGKVGSGSVVFRVIGDGKELYNSGVVKAAQPAREVSVNLAGISVLELVAEDAGDGTSGDHADWLNAAIQYAEITPALVDVTFQGQAEPMNPLVEQGLKAKIAKLPKVELPLIQASRDWLIDPTWAKARVEQTHGGKDIVLSNGLVSRVFRVFPNLATVDLVNLMNGESLLRAVSCEGVLRIDGRNYALGGLDGQFEYGYTTYDWIDALEANPTSFRVTDLAVSDITPHINWANRRWSLVKKWNATGKVLTFSLEGAGVLQGVKVKVNYAMYDEIPVMSKWIEVENLTNMSINLDSFTLEQLALAEPESPVGGDPSKFLKPNLHVQSDWGFNGFIEREVEHTEFWSADPRYTSQCNYSLATPCLLEVKPPMGPNVTIAAGGYFQTFRTWIMPMDSRDRERAGLFQRRMYAKIAPWLSENPIFMHCTSSDPKVVREAIDQCAATGYEMIILSFGSGLNMEDESPENYAKFRSLVEYAHSKGIELGGYSLLSSRWISDEVDVINPKTGKRGGMIFGSSPCLSSEWGYDYFRKVKKFYEQTGMSVFENDGSYPGNVCASTEHAHHKGLLDSQWEQRAQIEALYRWMCENGIYMNIPDFGYVLNGVTKVGIGYREVNWSLPRERQLVLGRQVMYDGLWERMPSMCWTFVPLTQYHGGGAAATLEPLSEHLVEYKAHMMQNYGTGVQACYRGHRLYDTEQTKQVVIEVIDWYKKYRDILNSDLVHLRRPDGRDYDGIMHVNPNLKQRAMIMLYNPTDVPINRSVQIPLYYTGLTDKAKIRKMEDKAKTYSLNRDFSVNLQVEIPARGCVWYVVE